MLTDTLPLILAESFRRHGDRTAFLRKAAGRYEPISYAEAGRAVRRLASSLLDLGVAPGDRVAILSTNCPEWVYADLAALWIGASTVPIYPTLNPAQVRYILSDSGSRVVFVSHRAQMEKVQAVRGELPGLEHAVAFDAKDCPETVPSLAGLLERRPGPGPEAVDARSRAVGPEDLASLIYTSGTTGEPKGVMLTHRAFASNALAAATLFDIGPGDMALSFLPLSHVFERTAGYYAMLARGVAIAYAESVDTVPQNLLEIRPTVMLSVPRLYEKMHERVREKMEGGSGLARLLFRRATAVGRAVNEALDAGGRPGPLLALRHALADRLVCSKIRERTGGRLRYSFSGGAPLEPRIARFFRDVGLVILEGYGLTEAAPIVAANTPRAYRLGTVGKPIPGVEVRLAQDGEILVRGPNVMKGYFRNPRATAEALDPEGWLHTGDVGEFDGDGFLSITDRKKDLFKTSGGKYVAPQQIENLLKVHPLVSQAVAIGERRKYVSVLLVPNFARLEVEATRRGIEHRTREELLASPAVRELYEGVLATLTRELARFETPKKFALLPEELTQERGELTPTLKVKRKVVEEKYRAAIEGMYAGA